MSYKFFGMLLYTFYIYIGDIQVSYESVNKYIHGVFRKVFFRMSRFIDSFFIIDEINIGR